MAAKNEPAERDGNVDVVGVIEEKTEQEDSDDEPEASAKLEFGGCESSLAISVRAETRRTGCAESVDDSISPQKTFRNFR